MRKSVLVFEVANCKFGLNLDAVEEVVPAAQYTRVPNSPPFFLGLTAVRGKVIGVIDAARRYRLGPSLNSHYVVCYVRGNLTAIAIDRPIIAGDVLLKEFTAAQTQSMVEKAKVDPKFVKGGFEVLETSDSGEVSSTGIEYCEVDPDLFVSAEMASKIGEV